MAISKTTIEFFLEQINHANLNSISGICGQLYKYLNDNIKDNPVFDAYMNELNEWEDWPDGDRFAKSQHGDWAMPVDFDAAKSLAFSLYNRLAHMPNVFSFLFYLTGNNSSDQVIYPFNLSFLGYLTKALQDILNANPELEAEIIERTGGDTVFIIHGHDELIKKDLQLLLTRAGVNHIVLHEQPDQGRSIVDKLIEESSNSNFAIALLTPDDLLASGSARARQNVILEIGYFLGRLGKKRVRMLVKGDTEIPGDLDGILYEKHDEAGAWKSGILKELIAVGIYVDLKSAVKSL